MEEMLNDECVQMALGNVETGLEWEMFQENIRPLKRGRNISLLNQSLKAQIDPALRSQLIQTRKKMLEAIEEYKGDDPLHPWIQCIKWVQEAFPAGGDCSGLVVIYEQCVRKFWHESRYKEDLRYLKIWLEYAGNCEDAEVIYGFLEANGIGQSHAVFYSSYALHMESKNKLKKADDIFNLGIAREAKPVEKLRQVYRSFLARSTRRKQLPEEEDSNETNENAETRSFGTVLNGSANNISRPFQKLSNKRKPLAICNENKPLSIWKDENAIVPTHKNDKMKAALDTNDNNKPAWMDLGTRADRNKENNAIPTKWTSFKIPQRAGVEAGQAAPAPVIQIYVDEECKQSPKEVKSKSPKQSGAGLKLRRATSKGLKTETELLKENPLRNFPLRNLR
ncbi:hypothetical protein LUZ60_017024 [Juncus effusus]|nr:hypothetical protein LUZ60_017024 [Juncus effusus]